MCFCILVNRVNLTEKKKEEEEEEKEKEKHWLGRVEK